MAKTTKAPVKTRQCLEVVAVLLFFILVVLVRFGSMLSGIADHYIGGTEQDAGLYVWLFRTFYLNPFESLRLESNAFYPYGLSRAWSDNFLAPSALSSLLLLAGVTQPLAYNALLLGAVTLNGLVTYYLARSLGGQRSSSLAAGLLFQNCAYLWSNFGHPQLVYAFFLPLSIILSITILRKHRFKEGLLLGLTVCIAFLTTVYYSIFCVLIAAYVLTPYFVLEFRKRKFKEGFCVIAGIIVGIIPLLPFLLPYMAVREAFKSRDLYEAYYFSASITSYVSFSQLNSLWGFTSTLSHAEGQLGSSFALLILVLSYALISLTQKDERRMPRLIFFLILLALTALTLNPIEGPLDRYLATVLTWLVFGWACWLAYRFCVNSQREFFALKNSINFLFSLLLVFFLFSIGPLGNSAHGEITLSVFSIFYRVFPGMDSLRAAARYGSVVLLCLALLGPLIIQRVIEQSFLRYLCLFVLVACGIRESRPKGIAFEEIAARPAVLDRLTQEINASEAAIFLPLTTETNANGVKSWGDYARLNTRYMNWSIAFEGKIVNGYSGQRSKLILELPKLLEDFPSARSIAELGTIAGLRYIVATSELVERIENFDLKLAKFSDQLYVLERDSSGNMLLELQPNINFQRDNQPKYLLVPPNKNLKLDWKNPIDPLCKLDWASAKTFYSKDLVKALRGSINSIGLEKGLVVKPLKRPFQVRPVIVALGSHCNQTLERTSVLQTKTN